MRMREFEFEFGTGRSSRSRSKEIKYKKYLIMITIVIYHAGTVRTNAINPRISKIECCDAVSAPNAAVATFLASVGSTDADALWPGLLEADASDGGAAESETTPRLSSGAASLMSQNAGRFIARAASAPRTGGHEGGVCVYPDLPLARSMCDRSDANAARYSRAGTTRKRCRYRLAHWRCGAHVSRI